VADVPDGAARLWWLYGPPCAGKSSAAWHLHEHLLTGPRAHVDVDQVGMSYPERSDDPGRHVLKTRAAGALVRRLASVGARTVVVSGVLDPRSLHALRTQETPGIAVTSCRLRVGEQELARRLRARYDPADVERALEEARAADARADGNPVLDAGADGPAEVARRVRQLLESADATVGTGPAPAAPFVEGPAVAVLVCGTTAVGTSTAGFALFSALLDRERPSSFLDLAQLSLWRDLPAPVDDPDGSRLTAACVADVWRQHRAAGARTLVLVGHVATPADVRHLRAALGDVPLLVCRVRAGRSALLARIRERTLGLGPALAGDTLVGLDADGVRDVLDRALASQQQLDAAEVADVVLDTDDLDAAATAERLLAAVDRRVEWAGPS
jgi:hypothetical protein